MKCILFATLSLVLILPSASGQAPSFKWGDVRAADLEMTHYPADSNAVALILAEQGRTSVDEQGRVEFRLFRRIKFLSAAAYDAWGTVQLSYWTGKDFPQSLDKLRAQTVKLGPNGKVVEQAVSKKDFFKEKVSDTVTSSRFTFPALEPGVVLEYEYVLSSESPQHVPDWYFQHDEPTLWSEYMVTFHPRFGFVRVTNVPAFDVETSKVLTRQEGALQEVRWAMKDLPALRAEPYTTTLEDYRARIRFQLSSYVMPGQGIIPIMKTWDALAEELRTDANFGQQLNPTGDVRDLAARITAGLTTPREKMEAIHAYVRQSVTWNSEYGFLSDVGDLDTVLRRHTGSVPDLAFLLIALLRAVDIDADPVLISTRGNGAVEKGYPLYSQFDYVIAHAVVGGASVLLDATEPLAGHGLLPLRALNGQGWLVRDQSQTWIEVASPARHARQVTIKGHLDETGALTATFLSEDGGYAGLERRNALAEAPDEASFFQTQVFEERPGIAIDSIRIERADSLDKSMRLSASLEVEGYGQAAGDFIYLSPYQFERLTENPLRPPTRSFPVDFGYPSDLVYTLELALPEGFRVQETPQNMNLRLPENGGSFSVRSEEVDGVFKLQSRLVLSQPRYAPRAYVGLREFMDRVVAAHAEQVVLQRTDGQ
ncbi:MAG: DUF3857 domain-containing protein [Rhodothermales bacterium]|nr:DUF3857 domain-containing protein [Rhodothermales bacterium]